MLPRWYPNKKDTSDGNFIENHIRCISSKLKVCTVFVKGIKGETSREILRINESVNLKIYIRYFKVYSGLTGLIINPLSYLFYLFKTYSAVKRENGSPVLSHVHVMARSSVLANYLLMRNKIPFVLSEHWSGYYPESGKLSFTKRILYKMLASKASAVSAVSASLAESLNIFLKKQATVIPNLVQQEFFKVRKETDKTSIKTLIHVSNLIFTVKQTDKILLYLNELAEKRKDFEIIIVGKGPDKEKLELLAKGLHNLKNRLIFKGDLPASQIAELFSKSKATVSFSRFETQSIVLLESIATGTPVIAPKIGGIPEHCEGKGILFEVNSKQGFLKSIEEILDEKIIFDPFVMRQYTIENFSEEVIARKFTAMYKKVIPSLNVQ